MSSSSTSASTASAAKGGKVSRVRPMQRAAIPRPVGTLTGATSSSARPGPSSATASIASSSAVASSHPGASSSNLPPQQQQQHGTEMSGVGVLRQRQLCAEQAAQLRELESHMAELRKKNIQLQREMQEAYGLQQLKSRTVDALTKDLNGKVELEKRVNDFLASTEAQSLDDVLDELQSLRKKCARSEDSLVELNEKYRKAAIRKQQLEDSLAELKAELATSRRSDPAEQQESGLAEKNGEDLKSIVKRNASLEQKCESLAEFKDKIVKLEIEKRDLKAENTQLKGKLSSVLRDKKALLEKITHIEGDSAQKLKELKDAQTRHLEMLSKLRRSHTKIETKYKHLLKERTQWQSLFRTANGDLSKSTESLASISSATSSSVSRTSFFRDSSNLEEYNIHLESELVAAQESLKVAEKERDRLDRKLKTLAEQVLQDESLITELDQHRIALLEERDKLKEKCLTFEENNTVLQRTVDELREQLDTALFENNELSLREDESCPSLSAGEHSILVNSSQSVELFEQQTRNLELLKNIVDQSITRQELIVVERLEDLRERLGSLNVLCEKAKSLLSAKDEKLAQQEEVISELTRQVDVLKNNAESLAKDLGEEMRDRNATEMGKLQDEISAQDAKMKNYEKMQKVLKKALMENERLKENEELLSAKIGAAESRVVELETQLKCEQQLVTDSNGKLNQRLRQAELENERLQNEFAVFKEQIAELERVKDALASTESDGETLRRRVTSLERSLEEATLEVYRLSKEVLTVSTESEHSASALKEATARADGLKMTLTEKAQQIARLIQDLEAERSEKASIEMAMAELREEAKKHQKEVDGKMAHMADEVKSVNRELESVLHEKAKRIEVLEKQALDSELAQKRELDKLRNKLEREAELQGEAKAVCESFVASLKLELNSSSLSLYEFLPQMAQIVLEEVSVRAKRLDDALAELEQSRKHVDESVSYAHTVQQLQDQLGKDEQKLKRYEQALADQSALIERMKTERAELETSISELRVSGDREIQNQSCIIKRLEAELEEARSQAKRAALIEAHCNELEAQHGTIIGEKDATIADLERQLEQKLSEMADAGEKLKALDGLHIIQERLDAATVEVDRYRAKSEALQKDLEDREDKLKCKNQVIQELERELSEKVATFDEMEKVFTLKGEEYKKVREMLDHNEETITKLSNQLCESETAMKVLCGKLLPNVTNVTSEMYSGLAERANELFEELQAFRDRSAALEKIRDAGDIERKGMSQQIADLTCNLAARDDELRKAIESIQSLTDSRDKLAEELALEQNKLLGLHDELRESKIANESLLTNLEVSQNVVETNSVEISNLRKLLAGSENVISGLSEQRNEEITNLMDQIQSLDRERETLQALLEKERESKDSELQRMSAIQVDLKTEAESLVAEKDGLLAEKTAWEQLKAQLEEQVVAIKLKYNDKCQDFTELEKALEGNKLDMGRLQEKFHALKQKYGETIESLQTDLSQAQIERAELLQKIQVLDAEAKSAVTARAELETSLQNKCESVEVLRSEIDLLDEKLRETCSQYEESVQRLNGREAEVGRLMDEIAEAKMTLSERSEDVNSYHDHVKTLAEEKVRLEAEVAGLKRRIEENSEEYQKEALEIQQDVSFVTERYNIKCHEYEMLSKNAAENTSDINALTLKLLSMESNLSNANSRVEELENALAHEKANHELQLRNEVARGDVALSRVKELEEKLLVVCNDSARLARELAEAQSQLNNMTIEKDKLTTICVGSEAKAKKLENALEDTKAQSGLQLKELLTLNDLATSSQTDLQMELESVRILLLDSENNARSIKIQYEDKLNSLQDELSSRTISEESLQRGLQTELASMRDSMSSQEMIMTQRIEETSGSLETSQFQLDREKELSECLRREKQALEDEMTKLQTSFRDTQSKLDTARHLIKDLEEAKQILEAKLQESVVSATAAQSDQEALREELAESRESAAFLEKQLAKLRNECADLQLSFRSLAREKAALEHKYTELSTKDVQGNLRDDARDLESRRLELESAREQQLEAARSSLVVYRNQLDNVCKTLGLESAEQIVPLLRRREATVAQLGSGVLMIRRELRAQRRDLDLLRQLVASQRAELTVFVGDAGSQLSLAMTKAEVDDEAASWQSGEPHGPPRLMTDHHELHQQQQHQQDPYDDHHRQREHHYRQQHAHHHHHSHANHDHHHQHRGRLVELCLSALRQHNLHSLSRAIPSRPSLSPSPSAAAAAATAAATTTTAGTRISGENEDVGRLRSASVHDVFAPSTPLDDFDMHFQTFNGPTAQFVAEQQASSAARRKLMQLAAAMSHDDITAPPHADIHKSHPTTDVCDRSGQQLLDQSSLDNVSSLSGTSQSSLLRIDPFDTIKQQKILIHELMAKLEGTKKALDGEVSRRKELDERFRLWSNDKRLHNAQVSFNVAQTRRTTADRN